MKKIKTFLAMAIIVLTTNAAHAANWFTKLIGAAGSDEVARLQAQVAIEASRTAQIEMFVYVIGGAVALLILAPYICRMMNNFQIYKMKKQTEKSETC